jgi:hypothetical protein
MPNALVNEHKSGMTAIAGEQSVNRYQERYPRLSR